MDQDTKRKQPTQKDYKKDETLSLQEELDRMMDEGGGIITVDEPISDELIHQSNLKSD
jgi:hypothetical protein